jgi:hypothetical protein
MIAHLLIAGTCLFSGLLDSDTTHRKWAIGYDQGISARYFPRSDFGCGLILQPLGGDLFEKSESTNRYSNNYATGNESSNMDQRGLKILIEAYYQKKFNSIFLLTPYINIGGGYGKFSETSVSQRYYPPYDTLRYPLTHVQKRSTSTFLGTVGIMPGVRFGRFTAEFRLGISGLYTKTRSPDESDLIYNDKSRRITFIYPAEFVRALVFHFSI